MDLSRRGFFRILGGAALAAACPALAVAVAQDGPKWPITFGHVDKSGATFAVEGLRELTDAVDSCVELDDGSHGTWTIGASPSGKDSFLVRTPGRIRAMRPRLIAATEDGRVIFIEGAA